MSGKLTGKVAIVTLHLREATGFTSATRPALSVPGVGLPT